MASLRDKVIVITGSTRGFGLAHACADEGAQVTDCLRDEPGAIDVV